MIPSIQMHPALPPFSRLVYGAWRLADAANATPQTALRNIEICLDQGITTFDHADIYGGYRCEALFGAALKLKPALKRQLQLVGKCDIMLINDQFPARRVKHYDTSASHIRASVEQSLSRLVAIRAQADASGTMLYLPV